MVDELIDFHGRFGGYPEAPANAVEFAHQTLYARRARVSLGRSRDALTDAPVPAEVNAGRWIARCECGGAEYVDLTTLLFMCCSCWNAGHGHQWRTVELPPDPPAVEAALVARPDARNRNWRRPETVDDLLAENATHGVQ